MFLALHPFQSRENLRFMTTPIGPVKQTKNAYNCDYFLTHKFKHMFGVLKRTVSLRWSFCVPTTYVLVEK